MQELKTLFSVVEVDPIECHNFYSQAGEDVDPRAHDCRCYCAYVDGRPVGAVVLLKDTPMRRWRIYKRGDVVSSMLVLPEYRRRGIARALMSHVIENQQDCYLSVLLGNDAARALYESLGFFLFKNGEGRVIMKYDRSIGTDRPLVEPIEQNDLFEVAKASHDGFGYVSAKLNERQARTLYDTLTRLGVKKALMPEKYHVTLMYDRNNPVPVSNADRHRAFRAYMTDYDVMGEGKWRAVVIHLRSEALDQRHRELLEMGFTHSYPDYKCHLSLKYTPTSADVDVIRENIDHIRDLFSEGLLFERETWEPIEE